MRGYDYLSAEVGCTRPFQERVKHGCLRCLQVTTDGSSVISESRRSYILVRDGGLCILCGDDPVDVAHIVAQKSGDIGQVPFIHSISPSLSGFRTDDHSNLICLCGSHHRQFDAGYFVFVPSKSQRQVLFDHEQNDFAHRESLIGNGQPDPGRSLPNISDEIEYVPIHRTRFRAYFHHPTRYDQTMFSFDTADQALCPDLHFHASPICLMIQAQAHLCSVVRLRTERADKAQSDVTTLLKLYQRRPTVECNNSVIVPVAYHPVSMLQPYSDYHAQISFGFDCHLEMPGLTPCSSTSAMDASEDTEVNSDLMDPQLLEYTKERAVTWEDLKTRPPLFPGDEGGTWQFSNAEEVIRGWH